MTPIAQTLTSGVGNSLQTRSAPPASPVDATAARIEKARQLGTSFEDPSLGGVVVALASANEPKIKPYGELRQAQKREAGEAMATIKQELGKIDAQIAKRRPDLAGQWDFQLVDGKFKVTGLNADDAKWLERRLNANPALKGAAESFVSTAVENLEASAANPARAEYNYLSRKMEVYNFENVKTQLADKLGFRSLLAGADQISDSNNGTVLTGFRGQNGLDVVARLLTPSHRAIEGPRGPFYTAKYDPLQS